MRLFSDRYPELLQSVELDPAYFEPEPPALSFFAKSAVRDVQSHRYDCRIVSPRNGSTIEGTYVILDIQCAVKPDCPPVDDCLHCHNMCELLSLCKATSIVISTDGQVRASALVCVGSSRFPL